MQAMGGGEKLTLVLAEHLSRAHNVQLFCAEPLDIPLLAQFFGVDLSRVTVSPLDNAGAFWRVVAKVRGIRAPAVSLQHYLQLRKLKLDIFINNSYASRLRCPAARGIFICMFPHPTPRLSLRNAIASYSKVVAISEYSAHWVRQMWNRCSELIYPPCDDMGPPATKRNIILHVGRFIADKVEDARHHPKQQGLLLEVFRQMTDLHRDGWELHFAGSGGSDRDSKDFIELLKQNIDGVPVFFHLNTTRDEIRDLYRAAAIYWHATGYGFDVDKYPGKQEHFGIATVEAMSAAAVPVVYSSGGQKEIVTDGVNGFCWDHVDGLKSQTRRLANDPALRCTLGQQAVVSSKRFGREAFAVKVDQLIAGLLSERKPHL
jgi:glycosyltransferase involved in cell wall biosynthesis